MTQAETASFIRAYLDGDTAVGNIIPIRDVLESAITYLKEQPSLSPEDLEEAAMVSMPKPNGIESNMDFSFMQMVWMFERGVEWDRSTVKAELLEWAKENRDSSGRISYGELIEKINTL